MRSVMTSAPSYNGMNADTGTSGVFANGTRARNTAADRSTTVVTSARSFRPAARPDGMIGGASLVGTATGRGELGRTSGEARAGVIVKRICRPTASNGVLNLAASGRCRGPLGGGRGARLKRARDRLGEEV